MNTVETKATLTDRRVKLIEKLTPQLDPGERARVQEELRVVNAKLKALNTTEAYRLKAEADQRKAAGLAEAEANAARARANAHGIQTYQDEPGPEDDDPGQTAAIDGWIDSVLLRHDVDFTRSADGHLALEGDAKWAAVIGTLVDGIYAAAQGHELPDLPKSELKAVTARKPQKAKPKKR